MNMDEIYAVPPELVADARPGCGAGARRGHLEVPDVLAGTMRGAACRAVDPARTRGVRMRRLGVVALAVLVGTLLSGCLAGAATTAAPRAVPVAQLPEAALIYPGATPLAQGAQSGEGGFIGAQATPQEIIAYYDRELVARGWERRNAPPIKSVQEEYSAAWLRDGLVVRLSTLYQKDDPRLPPLAAMQRYQTVYRADILDYRNRK